MDPHVDGQALLPPPPPAIIPQGVVPLKAMEIKRVPMARPKNNGLGRKGQKIPLNTGRSGSPEGDGSLNEGDKKRSRRQGRSKTYKVTISYATKIPLQAIANALSVKESEQFQDAMRVLDIILRQNAAKQACLLVRQSFFHNHPKNFIPLGGGVVGCRGFHSSFRATQGGLSLNIDVSTTMIVKPGPVIDFLKENQNVKDSSKIDWVKAKRMLKNLRITVSPSNQEQKITGLSDRICRDQRFSFKRGNEDPVEVTVYEYFVHYRKIPLRESGALYCINVGKPKRPTFIPIELCSLVSLQRYTKSLSNLQRSAIVEASRQKPQEKMTTLTDALRVSNYNADHLLASSGISINCNFTQVEGRVLPAPRLKVGNGKDFIPRNGRWNFNNQKLVEPVTIERWAAVNFSASCDVGHLCRELIKCGNLKGIHLSGSFPTFQENPRHRHSPPHVRVQHMFQEMEQKLPRDPPQFLLCILPERKNCDIYGPWKRRCLSEVGIVTQCISPPRQVKDQYLTNVLLKINAKMGGINSFLTVERSPSIPIAGRVPTLILGMDVSHGSPGRADVPSIAAVVSSRCWPLISRYRAVVRTQSPKTELIDSLCKKLPNGEDEGIFRELLDDFFRSSGRKPEQIIIFRDGVSESQFNQVLNTELDQIMEACKLPYDEQWRPKFMLVVAQKNHHTKFFKAGGSPDNVPPGTVIDNGVCHPRNNDFYMCAHAGLIGTTRPTHYHVLYDELRCSADELQELVHSLSYVYQRSTSAISIVAPIYYAHLAAAQVSQFIKFDELSETSSGHGGLTSTGVLVPQLPKLHKNVRNSMFFC
ncbi:OLC1v1015447C1 [Oldenlandia corymbosa var. corymbosa]|uniref:OLC1v1015447C1 n=1 Tax=Oldenlandia corymbosa var. corymbosa TaxID=529605 RepID=A0AAV1E6K3_OLDCO|nr:OLC1v1015447C1 [Oldenlandia corymbosa var. corymbosa]